MRIHQGFSKVVGLVAILSFALATTVAASGTKEASGGSQSAETVSMTLFVDQTWYPTKDWSGPVPEEITRITGVRPVVTIASDANQLPLMIASGSLSDLVATSTQHKRMGQPDISHAWDALIPQYAPDFDVDPVVVGVNTMPDGHFYTIKNNFSSQKELEQHQGYALGQDAAILARADILEELGNPQIASLDDFRDLLLTVQKAYPSMIPFVTEYPAWHKAFFENQFGITDGFNEVDGDLVYVLNLPEYREMYLYMNELFRLGLIKPENLAFEQNVQAMNLAANGGAFAIEHTTGGYGPVNSRVKTAGNDFEFIYLPQKLNDDFQVLSHNVGWQGVYITQNNSDPARAINFMKFLRSEEGQHLAMWGREGEEWNWDDSQNYPIFNFEYSLTANQIERGVLYWGLLAGSFVTEAVTRYNPGSPITEISQEMMQYYRTKPAVGLVVPEADTDESVILANLRNMIATEETKVLLASTRAAASAAYDEMLVKARQIGIDRLEEWANVRYDEVTDFFN